MFLIIYVDDFKLAGKLVNFDEAWRRIIEGGIVLDKPTDVDHFLGCRHVRREIVRADGTRITTMTYDFENSLRNSVDRFVRLAANCGVEVKLKERDTHPSAVNLSMSIAPPRMTGHVWRAPGAGLRSLQINFNSTSA